ncbi:MAG: PP2C family protein-serine/threonine phosphatase [Actinomycetes bacterium]
MHRPPSPSDATSVRARLLWVRTVGRLRRRVLNTQAFVLAALGALTLLFGVLTLRSAAIVAPATLVISILFGGFLLSMRPLLFLYAVVAGVLAVEVVELGVSEVRPGSLTLVAATAILVAATTRSRSRLGVQGLRGETMLVDLRDRLRAQGEMPPLPAGWQAEVVMRSAGGASFSGDFLVSSRSVDGREFEVALVDVSGKGVGAGTRALLLSGAFGGLLGAMPRDEFLPAANSYLLRQGWEEGFATAAHLALDLETGEYVVSSAGHPPVAQFVARRGTWHLLGAEGVLLGLMPDAKYLGEPGRLRRGDALLLYTDGLIEAPGRDLSLGIDRLLGEAERLVTRGFRHGARGLVDAVATGLSDDRALVLIWRT